MQLYWQAFNRIEAEDDPVENALARLSDGRDHGEVVSVDVPHEASHCILDMLDEIERQLVPLKTKTTSIATLVREVQVVARFSPAGKAMIAERDGNYSDDPRAVLDGKFIFPQMREAVLFILVNKFRPGRLLKIGPSHDEVRD